MQPSTRSFSSTIDDENVYDDTVRGNKLIWNKFHDGSRYWKRHPSGRRQRPIFVAATRQHVGKTTTSLAIMSGLTKRFEKVGFLKPVGQQHVEVRSQNTGDTISVDKDVCLVHEHFKLKHLDYEHMSPVIIPAGYTKKFIDGEIAIQNQIGKIEAAMKHVTDASDIVLVEGTGHCGVGAIVGVSNGQAASIIGADVILVASGGLGSAFDELELNRVLCQHYNVRIAGVVINKVKRDKYDQIKKYMAKAMMQSWGIPLLGCIPDDPYLGCPALRDLEMLFKTKLICGEEHRYRHYNTEDINVVTTSLTRFLENLRLKPSRTLYICHVTRDDLIVGFMGEFQRRKEKEDHPFEAALLICGRKGKYQLSQEVMDMLQGMEGAPVMSVELSTRDAMDKIHRFTPKLNIDDVNRVNAAIASYEPYIDFDELLRRTQSDNSSFNEPGSIRFEDLRRI